MSRLANQRRLFLELIGTLRPHWRRDPGLPARVQRWLVAHRAGSRDRRLYRELAYTAFRILPWIEHASPDELVGMVAACAVPGPATEAFIAAYRIDPLPPQCDPELLLPPWLRDECPAALEPAQHDALLRRAPVWIRLQTGDSDPVHEELTASGWKIAPSGALPIAWRLEGDGDLTRTAAYRAGRFEIQDLGSQLLLSSVGVPAAQHWLDACAGAGGKTLQLGQALGPEGRVDAHDIRTDALAELRLRVQRAGLRNVAVTPAPRGPYDGILVDAPCTGSGTWRRAPHLKWVTEPADIARAAQRQRDLLDRWARDVRTGGRLVYATCSLCRSENEAVVEWFLEHHPQWQVERLTPPAPLHAGPLGCSVLPADVDSDAFFVSALRRPQ